MSDGRKTNGRPPGSMNKRTEAALKVFEELNFDPIRAGVELFHRALKEFDEDKTEFRFKYLEVAQREVSDLKNYCFPKLKSVDLTSGGEGVFQSFAEWAQQMVAKQNEPKS